MSEICIGKAEGKKVCISPKDLLRHQYVVGATGTGKSTLIQREALQAYEDGLCTWLIDPHGDLSYDVVGSMHKWHLNDLFFFDPLKINFSLNPFELTDYGTDSERSLLIERIIGEIVEFMKKLYGKKYWGPSLNRTFQNSIRTLYEGDDAPTFEEILKLIDQELEGPEFQGFYKELNKLPRGRTDAVVNKISPFVKNRLLRNLFCRKSSSLDLRELTEPGRLVIWRLSRGELSEMNMSLIGSVLIMKAWFSKVMKGKGERNPVFLCMDEFQNFRQLRMLEEIIAEGRKYGFGLLMAHQHTRQISKKLLRSVLGNTATKIFFRVSSKDASTLSKGMQSTDNLSKVLTSLPDGKALVKLRAGFGEEPSKPFEISTLGPLSQRHTKFDRIIERMRERYSAPEPPEKPSVKGKLDPELLELLNTVYELEERETEASRTNLSKDLSKSGSAVSELIDRAQSQGLVERKKEKEGRGRPTILTLLTQKGREKIGKEVSAGSSSKAGGELHRALLFRAKEKLEVENYRVKIPEQKGREKQPDMLAWERKGNEWGDPIAVEAETGTKNPDQIRKNYRKNRKEGRFVAFVTPDEETAGKIREILKGKEDFKVYPLEL